jgi:hypothetical protein
MKKRYFYEFRGNVYLEADNLDEAEELIMGISLEDYLIDEDVIEIDEHYIPVDLEKREEKIDTILHPLEDEYVDYHSKKQSYGPLFREFIHGKIDRQELVNRMIQVEEKGMDDSGYTYEIEMVDLNSKEHKRARHVVVD